MRLTGSQSRKIMLQVVAEMGASNLTQKIPTNRQERRALQKLRTKK